MSDEEHIKKGFVSRARDFGTRVHDDQLYGIFPYWKHLQDVENVLIRFGYGDDFELLAAAWLHDVMEDKGIQFHDIEDSFGIKVANLVLHVTDDHGKNRKERKANMYEKLKAYPYSTPLKIADRIANMEWSLLTNLSLLEMYIKEHRDFMAFLYKYANGDMFAHLEYLYSVGKYAIFSKKYAD
jgi:guanosine-3',5'-bis(diphosphate) 3'-pyrophosphohydrolase